jgi:hypothetical protein
MQLVVLSALTGTLAAALAFERTVLVVGAKTLLWMQPTTVLDPAGYSVTERDTEYSGPATSAILV